MRELRLSLALAATLLALPAQAECRNDNRPLPELPRATVKSDIKRLYFHKYRCGTSGLEQKCRQRRFLVGGDQVYIAGDHGTTFICIAHLGRGGAYSEGRVPIAGLQFE